MSGDEADEGYEWRTVQGGTYDELVPVGGTDEPPECPISHPGYGYDRSQCRTCSRRREWVRRDTARWADEQEAAGVDPSAMVVPGSYVLDLPPISIIWGTPSEVLAAEGQAWMIMGPDGTGKTTEACNYVKARLGLPGWGGHIWDLPVAPLPDDRSAFYLAMDRPRQMMEAFQRGLAEDMREELDSRLFIQRGPPPWRLGSTRGREWLLREAQRKNVGLVVIDSRKDAGSTLDAKDVTEVATTVQMLVAADVEVLILAHPVKTRSKKGLELEDVSGFREVFSGLGSVIALEGRAGSKEITVRQVKPIRERVPKFKILRDPSTGRSERLPEGIVVDPSDGALVEGRAPVDAFEKRVLACIDAHSSGWAPAASLKDVLRSGNLSRDLRRLLQAEVIEHNGQRAAQSAYRRGPKAPPPPLPPPATGDQRPTDE